MTGPPWRTTPWTSRTWRRRCSHSATWSKEANRYANGDRAGVKVLVSADLEQKRFELDVHLVMTIWEQAKLLMADDNVRSAKDIAEWLGIIGMHEPRRVCGRLFWLSCHRLRGP